LIAKLQRYSMKAKQAKSLFEKGMLGDAVEPL